jgi:hypothetical protein
MSTITTENAAPAIWERIIRPDLDDLSPEEARAALRWKFSDADRRADHAAHRQVRRRPNIVSSRVAFRAHGSGDGLTAQANVRVAQSSVDPTRLHDTRWRQFDKADVAIGLDRGIERRFRAKLFGASQPALFVSR